MSRHAKPRAGHRRREFAILNVSSPLARLALPAGLATKWPYLQPTDTSHVAIILFGRIGKLEQPSSSVSPDLASPRVVRLAYRSFRRHVLDANPSSKMDMYCHSWHPQLSEEIDGLYRPIWSRHEPLRSELNGVQSAGQLPQPRQ